MENPEFNAEEERWLNIPDKTTVGTGWVVLVLDTEIKILSLGDTHQAGAQVHVLDRNGYELKMWEVAEWERKGEGELVMGAFLMTAADPWILEDSPSE